MSERINAPVLVWECETYYRDKGRRGEPCGSFSQLTAVSTDAEIDAAAGVALERIKATVHSPADETVFKEIGEILETFARAYVVGLQERRAAEKQG